MPPRHRPSAPHPLELHLPFHGTWTVQNSPANRVPSHGTDLFGTRYAIDFIAVDRQGRTAASRSWRSALTTEPPELFFGYGLGVLAPRAGTVRVAHDGEADHAARRSQLSLVRYALGQPARIRQGPAAIAGNHVILEEPQSGRFIAVVHLRQGSIRVRSGETVSAGQLIGECGNSGNSTQPHIHLQAMDGLQLHRAQGVPIVFRDFRERLPAEVETTVRCGLPFNDSVVSPVRTDRFPADQTVAPDWPR